MSRPDVEIEASAVARELRALRRPRTRSRVSGSPDVLEGRTSRRRKLPKPLARGAVYRDIAIGWQVAARLPDDGALRK